MRVEDVEVSSPKSNLTERAILSQKRGQSVVAMIQSIAPHTTTTCCFGSALVRAGNRLVGEQTPPVGKESDPMLGENRSRLLTPAPDVTCARRVMDLDFVDVS